VPGEQEWAAVNELARAIFFSESASFDAGIRRWTMAARARRQDTLAMWQDGVPVSMIRRLERPALVRGQTLRLGFIGSVCTHPDHRGRGLASALLARTLAILDGHGVDFVYITGTRGLYYGAGADHAALEWRGRLEAGMLNAQERPVCVREAMPADVDTLVALAEGEGTRVIRPRSDWVDSVVLRSCSGRRATWFLVETADGVPVGYLLRRTQRDGSHWAVETVGDRGYCLTALARLAEGGPLEVVLPPGDRLVALLSARGVAGGLARSSGTIKALDPIRTLAKLTAYFAARLGSWPEFGAASRAASRTAFRTAFRTALGEAQGEMSGAIGMGEDVLAFADERAALWTLLGPPPGVSLDGVRATGRLRELVERCLPIPLPSLYLNMI
jgi:predicted N-acetyltransferase YhbS